MARGVRIATLLLALAAGACSTAATQRSGAVRSMGTAYSGDRSAGEEIFAANCAACHGAHGEGGSIGPSLHYENRRMPYDAVVSWIEDPQPPMPRLYPKPLSERQVRDVAAYVSSL